MLSFFKRKNPYVQPAKAVYADVLSATRDPVFYTQYGVPDTFDGRFDLMLLHIFLILHRMLKEGAEPAKTFNQALFDVTFADMDQTLREMGIGDMGVPKHQRRMMKAFNGRMHAYEQALKEDTFAQALYKNLYGTVEAPDDSAIENMAAKAQDILSVLQAQSVEEIVAGRITFTNSEEHRKSA